MKAVLQHGYGPPESVQVDEVVRPKAGPGEVLVKVVATTVTRGEAMRVSGKEYRFTRLFTGVRRPRDPRIGSEFAGRVVEVGPGVVSLSPGDEVFGIAAGANAEYVVAGESGIVLKKPVGLSYEEAAAIPDGALLALSSLPSPDTVRGKQVLVYGAAGSIGSAAVQLLVNYHGATVSAVCDSKDVELVRSLGAVRVFDRFAGDFTMSGETYDVIFDAVGKHSFRRCRKALKPGGRYISMDLGFMYHLPLLALVTRVIGGKRASLGIGRYRREDLDLVAELVRAGNYRPVIDRRYPLDEVVEAYRYVESGQKSGSVVLTVGE